MLYFTLDTNKSGNQLQLIIDFETKTFKKGYCLFRWKNDTKLKNKKAMENLCLELKEQGFSRI